MNTGRVIDFPEFSGIPIRTDMEGVNQVELTAHMNSPLIRRVRFFGFFVSGFALGWLAHEFHLGDMSIIVTIMTICAAFHISLFCIYLPWKLKGKNKF